MRRIVDDCRGCGACLVVCKKNAISLLKDKNGFFAAYANEELCIDCGMCSSICSDAIKNIPPINKEEVFVAYTKDIKVLESSSSGGIGYQLAHYFIQNKSYACGAIYDVNYGGVRHIIADNETDLHLLQGTKYLQSDISFITKEIVSDKFEEGIIFGTPCQIAGLNHALLHLNKRHKFVLIDLFCHGIPSSLLWDNHLAYIKNKYKFSEISNVRFRNGKEFSLTINNKYKKSFQYDAFYYFYLRKLIMNRCCYSCPYHRSSFSDIRIGDFMTKKYMKLPFSPSVVIVNTDKGAEILQKIKPDIELFQEDYKNVDLIQDNETIAIPASYCQYLESLRSGKPPVSLARAGLLFAHIKGFIKLFLHTFSKYVFPR